MFAASIQMSIEKYFQRLKRSHPEDAQTEVLACSHIDTTETHFKLAGKLNLYNSTSIISYS